MKYIDHIEQLDKDIDEIEKLSRDYAKLESKLSRCDRNMNMYKNALDKACLGLQYEYGQVHSDKYEWNKDQWKEWYLEDVD